LDLEPQTEIGGIAQSLVAGGDFDARRGKIKEAIAAYKKAQKLDPTKISAGLWNSLGLAGCLRRHAAEVMFACEQALELEPKRGDYVHTRGLARALTGNYTGAVEDFQFFVKWAKDAKLSEDLVKEREVWIQELKSDRNPFDEATLMAMRTQFDEGTLKEKRSQ